MNFQPALHRDLRGDDTPREQEEIGPGTADPPCRPRPNLEHARGVIADMKDYADELVVVACEVVIEQSAEHTETVRARELIEVLT